MIYWLIVKVGSCGPTLNILENRWEQFPPNHLWDSDQQTEFPFPNIRPSPVQLYCAVCKLGVLHKVVGLPTICVMGSIPDICAWTSTQSFILGLFSYRYQCQKYLQYSLKCWNRIVSLSTESMSSWTKLCCVLNVSTCHLSCKKIEMKHYYFINITCVKRKVSSGSFQKLNIFDLVLGKFRSHRWKNPLLSFSFLPLLP